MGKNLDNIRPKGARVMLDRERHIRYTFAGFEFLLEKYGDLASAFSAMQDISKGIDVRTLGAVVDFAYAGLMHEDRSLTRDAVAEIIDLAAINELAMAIAESLSGAMPVAAKKAEGKNPQ